MSALRVGFPAAFVYEGRFEFRGHVHDDDDDLIKYLDYGHMIHHAKMTLAFLYV
jgi:leucyl aminopeptidase